MKTINKIMETIIQVSEDGEHTYSITKMEGQEKGKHMIVLLLYPTRNEQNMIYDDDTTKHVLSHMNEMGFHSVTMLNLFSKVVNGCRMSTRGITVDRENLDYITERYIQNEAFKDSTWVIAWGSSMSTSQTVNHAKTELLTKWYKQFPKGKLYQFMAPGIDKDDNKTVHPLFLGIRSKFSKWSLDVFDGKAYMKDLKEREAEKQERMQQRMKELAKKRKEAKE